MLHFVKRGTKSLTTLTFRQLVLYHQVEMGSLPPENRSIHSDNIEEIHSVPLNVIIRPIPSVLDENKVQSLMNTIQVS